VAGIRKLGIFLEILLSILFKDYRCPKLLGENKKWDVSTKIGTVTQKKSCNIIIAYLWEGLQRRKGGVKTI